MRVHRYVGAVIVSAAVIVGASACSNPLRDLQEKVVETGIEKIIESGSGLDGVDFSGAELPANFPSAVPLPDAKLAGSFHLTEDGVTTWALTYQSESPEIVADYVAQLERAGYSEESSGAMGGIIGVAIYRDDAHMVSVTHVQDDTESMLQVLVQEQKQ